MLLIIAPDANSVAYLLSQVTIDQTDVIGNVTLYTVTYNSYQFLIVISGYGKVNIARALTIATERTQISYILSIGTIGDVDITDPKIFSAIISKKSIQYDVNFTAIGEHYGKLPDMPVAVYYADSELIDKAIAASNAQHISYEVGKIATADKFVANGCQACCLHDVFRAKGVDAEAGAVGEVAYLNAIPYVSVKIICNNAANDAGKQYDLYSDEALLICQKIALSFVDEMII